MVVRSDVGNGVRGRDAVQHGQAGEHRSGAASASPTGDLYSFIDRALIELADGGASIVRVGG
jgi:hypothetical protein